MFVAVHSQILAVVVWFGTTKHLNYRIFELLRICTTINLNYRIWWIEMWNSCIKRFVCSSWCREKTKAGRLLWIRIQTAQLAKWAKYRCCSNVFVVVAVRSTEPWLLFGVLDTRRRRAPDCFGRVECISATWGAIDLCTCTQSFARQFVVSSFYCRREYIMQP